MYDHTFTAFPRADCYLLGHLSPPSPDVTPPPPHAFSSAPLSLLPPAHLIIPDQLSGMELVGGGGQSSTTTSGCSSYGSPSSLGSCGTTQGSSCLIQRSISSHSLHKNGYHSHFTSPHEFLDMESSSVRRVFSTGDLQYNQRSESPLSSESSVIIESMSRACKYSPEEKKERIERYRSKRNQRNFTKKIKYACRKTLADSRPRIRGRFARNDEIEKNPQLLQWNNIPCREEEEEDDDDTWINFLEAFSANSFA
ncbi:hypothetical protein K2173_016672 [Erythroxylum novogranatense]|uniref:CCT domain-containing protein n=1 Tax=Erythroxylum novogranatense TaxID=1862640 RepID=A0AAV8SGS7_9ROSI|nr:hypothetical protein K2173_016672 [Erythroxylum novogranatense]